MLDTLGDRMKMFEEVEAGRRFMPLLPVMARIDGRSFHRFCAGLQRPYDARLSDLMILVAQDLMEETVAKAAYTQSDEISLMWHAGTLNSQIWFDGRVLKMVSVLAAIATASFNRRLADHLPEKMGHRPFPAFDARVWNVPNLEEALNVFRWREMDATKNSVSMAARSMFSHKELLGKTSKQMRDMMFEKGTQWNDYPPFFKRGTFILSRHRMKGFTPEEIAKLPEKHPAKADPAFTVERRELWQVSLPPLSRVRNLPEVFFDGAQPVEGDPPKKQAEE